MIGYESKRALASGRQDFLEEIGGMNLSTRFVYAVTFFIASIPSHALAESHCGGENERACCIGERAGPACDRGLHEVPGCTGDCRCKGSVFNSSGTCRADEVTHCGGENERACCIGERAEGACDSSLHEVPGCHGDCRCRASIFSSSGTCKPDITITPCGGEGQRACCIGERATGPCDSGLYEQPRPPPNSNNMCRGGLASSSTTCVRPTPCGGPGERACCAGERAAGACDPGLYERPGAPQNSKNTCRGGVASSSGTCTRYTPCGGEGQRACCVGERSTACNSGLVESPGAPPNSRCTNNLLSSSGHCRKLVPQWTLPFDRGGCSYIGRREWTSTLIDGDKATCWQVPADLLGTHFNQPNRCHQDVFHTWGEFDVSDASCKLPHFETPRPGICEGDNRWYEAYLLDIPKREDPDKLCKSAFATINGVKVAPTDCKRYYTGEAGRFLIHDESCRNEQLQPPQQPQPCSGGAVSEVVGQNGTEHQLSVWTWEDGALPKQLIKSLRSGDPFSLKADKLPQDGRLFLLVLLDVTSVLEWNKTWVDEDSIFKPFDPDSIGKDGAIYSSKFYSTQVILTSCKTSGLGYNLEAADYYLPGAAREVPTPPLHRSAAPWVEVRRPVKHGCFGCAAGDAAAGTFVMVLAVAFMLVRLHRVR